MKKEPNTTKKLNPFTHIAIVIIITMLGLELFSYLTSQGENTKVFSPGAKLLNGSCRIKHQMKAH